MTQAHIDQKDYDDFRHYLESVSGIVLGKNKEYLVNSRLRPILKEKGFSGITELTQKIKLDKGLREKVIDAMTTNETLWFRDTHPFRIFREIMLPEFARKQKSLKIWCAACSTGQEPYSLSIEIEEYKRKHPGSFTSEKITATDISPTVLDIATEGVYEKLALSRGMPENYLKDYFKEIETGRWKIDNRISSRVEFKLLNLTQPFNLVGKFDIIFCRNVLIYFSNEMKQDILQRAANLLSPSGYLMLGASESMSHMNNYFEMVQCRPGIIYRLQ